MDIDSSVRDREPVARYCSPVIEDLGTITEVTQGCVGGIPQDAMQGADPQAFPANSGLFCE